MPPHQNGDIVIGRYVEQLGEVLSGKTYILITRNEGVVYKRLNKNNGNTIAVTSDNHFYPPYEIKASEILEIWEYQCSISKNDQIFDSFENANIKTMFLELKKDLNEVKSSIGIT